MTDSIMEDIWLPGKGDSTPMAQCRSTKIVSTIKWIRTTSVSIRNSLCLCLSPSVSLSQIESHRAACSSLVLIQRTAWFRDEGVWV